MSSALAAPPGMIAPPIKTVADLLKTLGDIPPSRIRLRPTPGTATEGDLLTVQRTEGVLCELVDGVLVEKAMGYKEAILAVFLCRLLDEFAELTNRGVVTGPDGTMSLITGLVRIPDVAFASWDRFPGRRIPEEPIPNLVPDLAVEVLSASNTVNEMARKRQEYFTAGVLLVWEVDRNSETVTVYTGPHQFKVLGISETLDGGTLLPGFTLPLRSLFGRLDRHG